MKKRFLSLILTLSIMTPMAFVHAYTPPAGLDPALDLEMRTLYYNSLSPEYRANHEFDYGVFVRYYLGNHNGCEIVQLGDLLARNDVVAYTTIAGVTFVDQELKAYKDHELRDLEAAYETGWLTADDIGAIWKAFNDARAAAAAAQRAAEPPAEKTPIAILKANGGKLISGKRWYCPIGKPLKLTQIAKPTRKGCKFLGWYTKSKGGTQVKTFAPKKPGKVTLYAHWKRK